MSYSRAVDLARALQAYAVKLKPPKEKIKGFETTSITSDVAKLIQAGGLRKHSFDNLFPTMFSIHGLDINMALTRAVSQKDITPRAKELATQAFNNAIEILATKYQVMTKADFYNIDASIQEFINIFNEGGTDTLDSIKSKKLNIALDNIKSNFKSPLVVQYVKGDQSKFGSIKVAFNSFNNLRSQVNLVIKKELTKILSDNKVYNSKLSDDTYLTTKVFNWGHTATEDEEGNTTLISGKLIAELMSADKLFSNTDNRDKVYSIIAKDFVQVTGQENTTIKLHHGSLTKGDPNVLSLVISSGVYQTAIVQNRRENQEDLSQAEARWKLGNLLSSKSVLLSEVFGVRSIGELVNNLLRIRSSPSILDKFGNNYAATLLGTNIANASKTISLLDKKVPIKKKRTSVHGKPNIGRPILGSPIRTTSGQFYSLANLQMLINTHLQDVISANMGDEGYPGGQRRILNYRTGRFAASAQVERMSQSREGAITAYYSYMKNPYATFEPTGKQGSPKTRDPRLLIAGSIREIAATKVGNKLRSVSI